jgi:hypothetical protein
VKSNTAPLSSGRKVISMLPILAEIAALNARGVSTPAAAAGRR